MGKEPESKNYTEFKVVDNKYCENIKGKFKGKFKVVQDENENRIVFNNEVPLNSDDYQWGAYVVHSRSHNKYKIEKAGTTTNFLLLQK